MTSAGTRWVEGYVQAWESNDREQIGALFTDDAVYEFRPDDPEALRVARRSSTDGSIRATSPASGRSTGRL